MRPIPWLLASTSDHSLTGVPLTINVFSTFLTPKILNNFFN
jgi:hypothetical protein